jgi:ParB-like chromosome segregation protein Spo0J
METQIYCAHDELVEVDSLIENPRNPNKHPQKQLEMLAKIIKNQGWRNPITVSNRSGFIVKGHGRLQAAKLAGLAVVPVDRQDYGRQPDSGACRNR